MPPAFAEALLALITVLGGVPLGLLMRSASEARNGGRDPYWISLGGPLGLIASILLNAVWLSALFALLLFVPRWLALHVLTVSLDPDESRFIWLEFLIGIGFGKLVRWRRWRRDQDFT